MGSNHRTPTVEDQTVVRVCVEYLNRNGVGTENIFGRRHYDDGMLEILRNEIIARKF